MQLTRRAALGAAGSAAIARQSRAQAKPTLRLGVLNDQSGPYRDTTGQTSVICCRQAVAEFNPTQHGFDVEVVYADHQNKADIAASISRQWFDQGVDAIFDVPNSSCALAVSQVAKEKDRLMLNGSATSTALTDEQCNPNAAVWTFDTYCCRNRTAATW